MNNIEKNAFCGIQIPKRIIPKEYASKYGVGNKNGIIESERHYLLNEGRDENERKKD